MPYDENLAERIRRVVAGRHGVTEKRMFGGLAFLLDGKMFCGIANSDLMVRVGPERYEAALSLPHVRPMDFTGRPMTGYVYVGPEGSGFDEQVRAWVDEALAFVSTLEAQPTAKRSRRSPRRP